jgi:formylglycine-generating enzyme required for sulfatase activity
MDNQKLEHLTCTVRDVTFRLVKIPAGSFMMGSNEYDREKPIHRVQVPGFWLAEYPCTQALYQALTGQNPSHFKGKNRPVEQVSWDDAQRFIGQLNGREEVQAQRVSFRLPAEAEWEYAARAGRDFKYAGGDDLHQVGWYGDNSHRETKPVGLKMPNARGLYDMSGNVYEWCEDDWRGNYKDAPADGRAWVDVPRSDLRVLRGGDWDYIATSCRAAGRLRSDVQFQFNYLGFRLARSQLDG